MMIADKLRKSILQAAIQGKLTEQLPTDGDARELLEKIRAEKQRLIKEKKIKKESPLPAISDDEIPFDIPDNWCWVRLCDISLKIHYGYTASAQSSGNTKLLRITDIQNDYVDWNDVPFCNINEIQVDDYLLHDRDIVIVRTGGTIGKSYIIKELNHKSVFASYLIRIIPCNTIDEKYLKYFMNTSFYWNQLIDKTQGTGQPNVNSVSLKNLVIPIPPLAEQKRIVARLEELLKECDDLSE